MLLMLCAGRHAALHYATFMFISFFNYSFSNRISSRIYIFHLFLVYCFSCLAPEIQLFSNCSILSDMFSLGLVMCSIFNQGHALIQANNSASTYLKQMETVSTNKNRNGWTFIGVTIIMWWQMYAFYMNAECVKCYRQQCKWNHSKVHWIECTWTP